VFIQTITAVRTPSLSTSAKRGKTVKFASTVIPAAAATAGPFQLSLWHEETKTVTKKVRGKKRKVKVKYWRSRGSWTMRGDAAGRLVASGKLSRSGKWKMYVAYSGSETYTPVTSGSKAFSVK
jgi:hypothetical protein